MLPTLTLTWLAAVVVMCASVAVAVDVISHECAACDACQGIEWKSRACLEKRERCAALACQPVNDAVDATLGCAACVKLHWRTRACRDMRVHCEARQVRPARTTWIQLAVTLLVLAIGSFCVYLGPGGGQSSVAHREWLAKSDELRRWLRSCTDGSDVTLLPRDALRSASAVLDRARLNLSADALMEALVLLDEAEVARQLLLRIGGHSDYDEDFELPPKDLQTDTVRVLAARLEEQWGAARSEPLSAEVIRRFAVFGSTVEAARQRVDSAENQYGALVPLALESGASGRGDLLTHAVDDDDDASVDASYAHVSSPLRGGGAPRGDDLAVQVHRNDILVAQLVQTQMLHVSKLRQKHEKAQASLFAKMELARLRREERATERDRQIAERLEACVADELRRTRERLAALAHNVGLAGVALVCYGALSEVMAQCQLVDLLLWRSFCVPYWVFGLPVALVFSFAASISAGLANATLVGGAAVAAFWWHHVLAWRVAAALAVYVTPVAVAHICAGRERVVWLAWAVQLVVLIGAALFMT